MSSKDKASSSSSSRTSSRPPPSSSSHKPAQGRQSSLGGGGGGKHAPSTRNTLNNTKNSTSKRTTPTDHHQKVSGKQGTPLSSSCAQSVVAASNSSKGFQKFTKKLQQIDGGGGGGSSSSTSGSSVSICENRKNLNEMATASFPSNKESLHEDERFREQETDVDDESSSSNRTNNNNNNNDSQEDDESTNLLLLDAGGDSARFRQGTTIQEQGKQQDEDVPRLPKQNFRSGETVAPRDNGDSLPSGWEQHSDKAGPYFWHIATGVIQRTRPSSELPSRRGSSVVVYHDDEEINQEAGGGSGGGLSRGVSSDDDTNTDGYYESGAALTVDDTSETTFVVYPVGCCEFDETQLMSATSGSKAIQKCILRLSNAPQSDAGAGGELEGCCWGLSQMEPILMRIFDDHIQFKDLTSQLLLRSQPIQTIKTWAVDDNNNFAFVIEDRAQSSNGSGMQSSGPTNDDDDETTMDYRYYDTVDYALLSEPILRCYVFRSADEDDMMSCRVAAKLNEEINRYKEQMINRISKSTRLQQMIEVPGSGCGDDGDGETIGPSDDDDDNNDDDDDDDLAASNELTMNVKYIGKLTVPRPTGIDVLNVAIDKCLVEATTRAQTRAQNEDQNGAAAGLSPLVEAKLHVSPSSVIVENVTTGEIIVECRIRYLTFMGISKRDIRWCGFIMQNATNKSFVAHCFECHPTAGHVCEAIQLSCSRMYEKIVKNSHSQPAGETISIIPSGSKIRNTLAKTLSRIKLNPLR